MTMTLKYFEYELTLGAEIPMPKPKINFLTGYQYSVQQFLFGLCKEHIGSLGKVEGKWEIRGDNREVIRLGPRPELVQIFDWTEELHIIEVVPEEAIPAEAKEAGFTPYRLTKDYWARFDKFAS